METSSNIPNTGPPKSTQKKKNQADRAKNNNNNHKKEHPFPTHLADCNLASFLVTLWQTTHVPKITSKFQYLCSSKGTLQRTQCKKKRERAKKKIKIKKNPVEISLIHCSGSGSIA